MDADRWRRRCPDVRGCRVLLGATIRSRLTPMVVASTGTLIVAACGGADTGAWWNTASPHFEQLTSDVQGVRTVSGSGDQALQQACQTVVNDADKLQADGPYPAASGRGQWQSSLTTLIRTAEDCVTNASAATAPEAEGIAPVIFYQVMNNALQSLQQLAPR